MLALPLIIMLETVGEKNQDEDGQPESRKEAKIGTENAQGLQEDDNGEIPEQSSVHIDEEEVIQVCHLQEIF